MPEFIYQMHDARKAHGSKVILDEVTLSFYPGAKIGVVGPNGMGKSTLLKIMAGLEDVSNGEARLTPGFTVGILQQEPELEEDKTVIENVRLAFGDMLAKIERFNQVSWRRWESSRMRSTRATDGISTASSRRRWTPCSYQTRRHLLMFCREASEGALHFAGSCWKLRIYCCSTSRPTTWMRSRSSGSSSF